MIKPTISMICAMDEERGIGKSNGLLWKIPAELKHFREITKGHPIIMGRKTYESIGRPLPDRVNVIITRDTDFNVEGCIVCHSLEEALEEAKKVEQKEIFIIGGGQIYSQALNSVDKLYLTFVQGKFGADTFFPDYSAFKKVVYESPLQEDAGYKYKFVELERS